MFTVAQMTSSKVPTRTSIEHLQVILLAYVAKLAMYASSDSHAIEGA